MEGKGSGGGVQTVNGMVHYQGQSGILRRNISGIIFGTDLVSEKFSVQAGFKNISKLESNIT